ncbi:DUF6504 family protein [Croceicoccus estronivorus]|uniref:DUF6504 family protein n=1 Tax=Croceicoccus estronivorus TaxID=1172626 RepID=UPI0012E78324|nr:DUF6504 family protein [Croceicoccus estronivorus]
MAIWLTRLAIDRWRRSEQYREGEGRDADPLALVTETAHGPRITAVNTASWEESVRAGAMLADARSLCPHLQVAPADPVGDVAFLERLALWAQRWGPWNAVDPPDGLLVDITGGAHLFGGEERLLEDVRSVFARHGLAARFAIAPTAGAAWALAHFGKGTDTAHDSRLPQSLILQGDADRMKARLEQLPVAALRLDEDVLLILRRLGLKKIGDIAGIGRDALLRRFRTRRAPSANPLLRLDQLLGLVPEPLLPVFAVEQPAVQRRLLEPIRHRELLDQVMSDCAQDMARELEGRGEGARRLELGLWRVDGEVVLRSLEMAVATRDSAHMIRLFGEKLADIEAGFGIELVRLRATWVQALPMGQGDFDAAVECHGTSLGAFIDRLTVRLGDKAVRRPVSYASHVPERAQHWQPPLDPVPAGQDHLPLRARPLKLLDRPERIAVLYATPDGFPRRFRWRGHVHEVSRVEGPERIGPEWWRERAGVRLRDYYRIEDGDGRRYWIYRLGLIGDGRGGMPEWFLQGLCS